MKKRILFFLLFGSSSIFSVNIFAQSDLRLNSVDAGMLQINSDPSISGRYPNLPVNVRDGALSIRRFLENPPQKNKPVFWLISDEQVMITILQNAINLNDGEKLKLATEAGFYRDDNNIVILVPSSTPPEWLQRLIFTEFSHNLIDELAPRVAATPVGWFHSGFASYLGWKAQGELLGQSREQYEDDLLNYYRFSFDPNSALALNEIESSQNWNAMLLGNRATVYSQAALVFLHLTAKVGLATAPSILRLYNDEKVFRTAFQRASGMTLDDFETSLDQQFYPGLKKNVARK